MSLLTSGITKGYLYFLLRRQMTSRTLRKFFAKHYDIEVGLYSYGCFDRWRMPGPMRVGRYCSIAASVRSSLQNHRLDALTTHPALYESRLGIVAADMVPASPLLIEDDVWIGNNVVILPGCKFIGRGAVVGAGSIVTRDVAPYSIVAGNPAKKMRDRFEADVIKNIEATRWWMLDLPEFAHLVKTNPELAFHPSQADPSTWHEVGTSR